MRNSALCLSPLTLYFFFFSCLDISHAQSTTANHTCQANQSTYPCQTFAFYRAMAPDFLDLASIGDLFSVSRVMIANPSNISSPSAPLIQNQRLLIPITCSCNPINSTYSMSFANLTYTIKKGDTFYLVSTQNYQNLTTYPYVEIVNPDLVPTSLIVGVNVVFPIFCSCPSKTQANYLISYVLHPSDNLSSIASQFNTTEESITDVNGNSLQPYETIFIPASQLPQLSQPNATAASPAASPGASSRKAEPKGKVMGLSVGLGLCGLLLILVVALWGFREGSVKRGREERGYEKQESLVMGKGGGAGKGKGGMEVNLMANVSDCLDKYRVFKIEELKRATGDFDDACLIQGSVYKGSIDGEIYAIKKMKWNAYEELKILQKVNHGNLVKLEGFCINPENANCYLIYEYLQNGSLHWWLHENRSEKLNWRTRLRIAIDVANGLQYIHEHTRPRVVHKDIKSSNILLDSTMRAKIANFGLAKTGFNAITTHIVGTQGYVAPEYISDGVVSTKMDVFSFGVVLLELITGKEAIDEDGKMLWLGAGKVLEGGEKKNEEKVKRWMDEALDGESCSMDGVMNVMNIAVACVNRDSSKRPSMVDIVYALCKSDDLFVDFSEDGLSANSIQAR